MEQSLVADAPPVAALSPQMLTYAQGYLDARKRAGYAWLDMGRFLFEAREEAKHSEWGLFLQATNTHEDWAKRLIAIYTQSLHDRAFADAVRTNFLSVATGYELTSASPEVRNRLLSSDTPPTVKQIRDEKRQVAKSAPAPTLESTPAALPPLPADLASDWTRWQNDDGTIGMATIYGYKLSGNDMAALESEARRVKRELAELRDHEWRVFYDPAALGRSDLHAYTASHQTFDVISASDIPHLALAAWWRRQDEARLPDLPNDVIDGLWLKGYDWSGTAWVKGSEVLRDLPLGELQYLAGVDSVPHLPPDFAIVQKRAQAIGRFLEMNMHGTFSLVDLNGDGVSDDRYPTILHALAELELAATQPIKRPCQICGKELWPHRHFDHKCSDCYGAIQRTSRDARASAQTLLRTVWPKLRVYNPVAMVSQGEYRAALDHIVALLSSEC